MNLEKKKEAEIREREGMTGRTIIMLIALFIAGVIAYFLASYLFDASVLTYGMFYDAFSVTRSQVPEWVFLGAVMLILVFLMMFFVFIGFAFASPEGRQKSGTNCFADRIVQSRKKE